MQQGGTGCCPGRLDIHVHSAGLTPLGAGPFSQWTSLWWAQLSQLFASARSHTWTPPLPNPVPMPPHADSHAEPGAEGVACWGGAWVEGVACWCGGGWAWRAGELGAVGRAWGVRGRRSGGPGCLRDGAPPLCHLRVCSHCKGVGGSAGLGKDSGEKTRQVPGWRFEGGAQPLLIQPKAAAGHRLRGAGTAALAPRRWFPSDGLGPGPVGTPIGRPLRVPLGWPWPCVPRA